MPFLIPFYGKKKSLLFEQLPYVSLQKQSKEASWFASIDATEISDYTFLATEQTRWPYVSVQKTSKEASWYASIDTTEISDYILYSVPGNWANKMNEILNFRHLLV